MQVTTIGLVSPTQSSAGETIEAADINTPVNQLAAVINGSIETANLADSAVTTAKLADASVTPAKLLAGTGSSWAWQTWTPTPSNWTIGTGGSAGTTANYIQIGKTVYAKLKSTLGSSGQSVGTLPSFTLPVTASSFYNTTRDPIGPLAMFDIGTATYVGTAMLISTTSVGVFASNSSGGYVSENAATATVPFTWVAGDGIEFTIIYEAA